MFFLTSMVLLYVLKTLNIDSGWHKVQSVCIHGPVTLRLFDCGFNIYNSGSVWHLSVLRMNVGKYDLAHRFWVTHGRLSNGWLSDARQ